jgi:hypothetical protein
LRTVGPHSALHRYCSQLCDSGGTWNGGIKPVAGFRLTRVEAVIQPACKYTTYEDRGLTMSSRRSSGNPHFNYNTQNFVHKQQEVLSVLREKFISEREPGTDHVVTNMFYSFHGTSDEGAEAICRNGLVAVRSTDAGYFGSGCYSTLNIEYAIGYARGDYVPGKRKSGPFKVIMFACSVAMAYPVTREVDYSPGGNGFSNLFGRPLKPGFDCHVVCVNAASGFQAVDRDRCDYVEVVIDQESQMLPVAVLWFEEI